MRTNFQEKVLKIVAGVLKGKFLTYKQVAEFAGNPRAYRVVANIVGRNRNSKIPYHRVIRNDYTIGGYLGSEKLSWKKAALLLRRGSGGDPNGYNLRHLRFDFGEESG